MTEQRTRYQIILNVVRGGYVVSPPIQEAPIPDNRDFSCPQLTSARGTHLDDYLINTLWYGSSRVLNASRERTAARNRHPASSSSLFSRGPANR